MILALSITPAILAVLALGILVYFKFFALVYDKDGMVYQAQGGPHLCNPPHSEDDGPIDGGVTDNSDLNAPKSIGSTQIISFDCRFSTMDIDKPGKLGNHMPKAGETPDYTATVAYPEWYQLDPNYAGTNGIVWYDSDGYQLEPTDTFVEGKKYKVEIKLISATLSGANTSQFTSPVSA